MSGFDRRIASGMRGLTYELFPFEAFDEAGRVRVPGSVQYPTYIREGLGTVARAPIWDAFYATLSVLDDPQWNVFSAGTSFVGRTANVVVFKSVNSVSGPAAAHQWSLSYQQVVARSLKAFSGNRYLVDPKWLSLLDEAMNRLPPDQKQDDPAKKPGGGQEDPDGALTGPVTDGVGAEVVGFVPWLLLGLRAMSTLLGRFTPRTEIRTTVFWYPTGSQVLDRPFAERWTPLHTDYMNDGTLRMLHALWEPAKLPHFWYGSGIDWKKFLWAMPHDVCDWSRSFYPTLSCGPSRRGGGLGADEAAGTAGPGAWDGIEPVPQRA